MSTIRLHVIDYDKLGLTWNIDVYYKKIKIETLNRNEFEEFTGLLAISTRILEEKYNIEFSPGGSCRKAFPFEVNCYLYNAEKLATLEYLLKQEFEDTINEDIIRRTSYEKEKLNKLIEYSSQEQVNEYINSLNEDNTLIFKIQELGLERVVDLKFIKNIDLIHKSRIQNLFKRKERNPEFYEDYDSTSYRNLRIAVAFAPKFESMMKKIEEMKQVV